MVDGIIDSKLKVFRDYIYQAMDLWRVPGLMITAVKDNEIIMQEGFGQCVHGSDEQVNSETLFPICSLTKSFTSTAMAMLVDAGYVSWFDKVADLLPDFYLYDSAVTTDLRVQDIFFHNSGLGAFSSSFLGFLGYGKDDIIHKLRYIKPTEEFRTQFQYHNGMYLVAGHLIEKLASTSWASFIQEHIFNDLQMTSSLPIRLPGLENCAVGHYDDEQGNIKTVTDEIFSRTFAEAAGIYSNAKDLSHWLLFHLQQGKFNHQRLLKHHTFEKLITPHITISFNPILPHIHKNVDTKAYGLGWFVMDYCGHTGLEHQGSIAGGCALMSFIPNQNIGIAMACNSNLKRMLLGALRLRFYDLCLGFEEHDYAQIFYENYCELDEKVKREKQAITVSTQQDFFPGRFLGTYENNVYGECHIILEHDKQLILQIGPNKTRIHLQECGEGRLLIQDSSAIGLYFNCSQLLFDGLQNGSYHAMTLILEADGGFGQLISIPGEKFLRVD